MFFRPLQVLRPRSLLSLLLTLGTSLYTSAQAQSLVDLYQAARAYDANYQSAKSQFDATLAKGEQSRALLLPTVALTAGLNKTNQDIQAPAAAANNYTFNSASASLVVSQPLYRPANVASVEQGKKQADLAQAKLLSAEQDLLIRVSQAYFDVLTAADNLTFVKRQKAAVGEQLASAKRNFEVGTATITDTREAQARFDLVIAQELAAENDVQVKSIALNQLVGAPNASPKPLKAPVVLAAIVPIDAEQWVRQSESQHPGIKQQEIALVVAQLETRKAETGHLPTLDLTGSYTAAGTNNGTAATANIDSRSNQTTVGLSFNLPLFSGYAVQNRVKETLALESKARTDLEATKRSVAQLVRTAYFGVLSGISQVKALEAAEASSQSALDATRLGYQVGVRINIDVLNAQSALFDTKAKLAKARYDVLLGELKLRQASGTLNADDLQAVNAQLAQ